LSYKVKVLICNYQSLGQKLAKIKEYNLLEGYFSFSTIYKNTRKTMTNFMYIALDLCFNIRIR